MFVYEICVLWIEFVLNQNFYMHFFKKKCKCWKFGSLVRTIIDYGYFLYKFLIHIVDRNIEICYFNSSIVKLQLLNVSGFKRI